MKKFIGLLLALLVAGCNAEDASPFVEPGFTEEFNGVQAVVQKEDRIHHRQLVAASDMVLVTYEVKPEFRVQKQRVERDLKKQLEEAYPSLKFVVSGDFKLHYEAKQLAKKEQEKGEDDGKNEDSKDKKKDVKKAIEDLKKLAEEET